MRDRRRSQPVQIRDRLTLDQRYFLFSCLLSDKVLLLQALQSLRQENLNEPEESHLRLLWSVIVGLYKRFHQQVDFFFGDRQQVLQILLLECRACAHNRPDVAPAHLLNELLSVQPPGYLAWLYLQNQSSAFPTEYGTFLLTAFLHEREISDALLSIANNASGGVVANVTDLVGQLAEREQTIAAIDSDPVQSFAPAGWLPKPTRMRPTGVTFLDRYLRGGHRAPEVNGVCGVNGAGKTSLALQLTFSVAALEQLWAADYDSHPGPTPGLPVPGALGWPYEMGHVYYFHYEMSAEDVRKKAISCVASVDHGHVEAMGTPGFHLSTQEHLSPAELELLRPSAAIGVTVNAYEGESERVARAMRMMARNAHMLDGTGNSEESPGFGRGYIPEIAGALAREQRKGRKVACVAIDWAGACVENSTSDKDEIYYRLTNFGRLAEKLIAIPFDCPVWVFQQLAGQENKRTAATRQTHGAAAGSSRFGEAMWACLNIGTTDEKSGVRILSQSKGRRTGLGRPPLLKVLGPFNRLVEVSHAYEFNRAGRVVEVQTHQAPSHAAPPPPPPAQQPLLDSVFSALDHNLANETQPRRRRSSGGY